MKFQRHHEISFFCFAKGDPSLVDCPPFTSAVCTVIVLYRKRSRVIAFEIIENPRISAWNFHNIEECEWQKGQKHIENDGGGISCVRLIIFSALFSRERSNGFSHHGQQTSNFHTRY